MEEHDRLRGATDVDGADWLFNLLDGRPETYAAHAEDYYERTVALSIVSHVFSQRRLTAQVAVALNPEADIELVLREFGNSDTQPRRNCRSGTVANSAR